MVSLFEGAIGSWRRAATPVHAIPLGHYYVNQQKTAAASPAADSLLPEPRRLAAAFASVRAGGIPDPEKLYESLDQRSVRGDLIARVHGDLNVRNVFVRWNSIDTILIDFSHSGLEESLARDPAKLETSIALAAPDRSGHLLPEEVLTGLYCGPLLPPRSLPVTDGRTGAIRQIRCQAGGEGIRSEEYEILTLCHLLRYAAEPLHPDLHTTTLAPRRSLSYRLAWGLLSRLP